MVLNSCDRHWCVSVFIKLCINVTSLCSIWHACRICGITDRHKFWYSTFLFVFHRITLQIIIKNTIIWCTEVWLTFFRVISHTRWLSVYKDIINSFTSILNSRVFFPMFVCQYKFTNKYTWRRLIKRKMRHQWRHVMFTYV